MTDTNYTPPASSAAATANKQFAASTQRFFWLIGLACIVLSIFKWGEEAFSMWIILTMICVAISVFAKIAVRIFDGQVRILDGQERIERRLNS